MLYGKLAADACLKLPALDRLLRINEQDEGTLGRTEHTVDLVDTDVAVLGGLPGGEGQLAVNGNGGRVGHSGLLSWRLGGQIKGSLPQRGGSSAGDAAVERGQMQQNGNGIFTRPIFGAQRAGMPSFPR